MLDIQSVCKSYAGRQVLAPVSFTLSPGQCLGVTGDNGSGKSTLLRLLSQIQRPDSGDIHFHGRSILGDRQFLRNHLGYVPQGNDLFTELTVAQQLTLWQRACNQTGPLPEDILDLLGLSPLLKCRIATLSGGTQRRVSIAMALLSRPDILIMDEATVGLDRAYCPRLLEWLKSFLQKDGYLIWCSHLPHELDLLCHHRLHLQDGQPSFSN